MSPSANGIRPLRSCPIRWPSASPRFRAKLPEMVRRASPKSNHPITGSDHRITSAARGNHPSPTIKLDELIAFSFRWRYDWLQICCKHHICDAKSWSSHHSHGAHVEGGSSR